MNVGRQNNQMTAREGERFERPERVMRDEGTWRLRESMASELIHKRRRVWTAVLAGWGRSSTRHHTDFGNFSYLWSHSFVWFWGTKINSLASDLSSVDVRQEETQHWPTARKAWLGNSSPFWMTCPFNTFIKASHSGYRTPCSSGDWILN